MRIDLFSTTANQISNDLNPKQVSARIAAQSAEGGGEDHATLTSDSTFVGSLVSSALSSPEVRQDKVASLRQAISSGQYEVDPAKIAASMVGESI